MPRYEDGKSFWHVSRSGATVVVTTGKLGRKGRTTAKGFASVGAAQRHHDDLAIAKVRAGFVLVEQADPPPQAGDDSPDDRLEALEARIAEDPTDAEAWMVYGDLLQRRGDPRGELAALQRAADAERAKNPRAKGGAPAAVTRYFTQHAPALLGPLAKHVRDVRDPAAAPFIWRNGVIYRAELASGTTPVGAILGELLEHRSGRLLVELSLRVDGRDDATAALEALAAAAPPALQELELFAKADLHDLGDVWDRIPRLRRLYVTARSFELGLLRLPELQRARFFGLVLSDACMDAIATAPWPRLERLELRLGGSSSTFEHVEPLLARADMPALTHLKIRGAAFAGAIARAIAAGPLAGQLVVLDLSHGSITPQDMKALGKLKHRFTALRELWLPAAALWNDGPQLVAGIAKHVIGDQRSPLDTLADELGVGGPSEPYDEDME